MRDLWNIQIRFQLHAIRLDKDDIYPTNITTSNADHMHGHTNIVRHDWILNLHSWQMLGFCCFDKTLKTSSFEILVEKNLSAKFLPLREVMIFGKRWLQQDKYVSDITTTGFTVYLQAQLLCDKKKNLWNSFSTSTFFPWSLHLSRLQQSYNLYVLIITTYELTV